MPLHRSAQGKMIDMSVIAAKNEKVRAVGNMNVNARGDIIDSDNKIIKDNTKRVKSSYQKIVGARPNSAPQSTKPVPEQKVQQPAKIEPDTDQLSVEEQELFEDDEDFEK